MGIGDLFKAGTAIFAVIIFLYFTMSIVFAPTPQVASEKTGEAITYFVIPWWVKAIEFFASIPVLGTLGILGVIGYLIYTRR